VTALILLIAIIVLIIVGAAVFSLALKLLWWVLIGLVIGALARLVVPGVQRIGLLATSLFGIGGALLGGVIARAIGVGSLVQFLIAIAVAAVLIMVLGGTRRGSIA
jgi:uncharacterized membrane protein YeaQ/YmgE (transglycosylase-associated protein family)